MRRSRWAAGLLVALACQRPEPVTSPEVERPPPTPRHSDGPPDAGSNVDGGRPAHDPAPGSWGLPTPPPVPLDRLLGLRRTRVETLLGRAGTSEAGGWTAYGQTWRRGF